MNKTIVVGSFIHDLAENIETNTGPSTPSFKSIGACVVDEIQHEINERLDRHYFGSENYRTIAALFAEYKNVTELNDHILKELEWFRKIKKGYNV